MALTVEDRPVRPLTADEAMRMVELGIIGPDERVELLHGVLTRMSPQHPPHATVTRRLNSWLAPLMVAGTHDVGVQLPLSVPDRTSLPEPDIAVVERDDAIAHPSTAVLVIEVAVSSLRIDTRIKPPLYAAAGVPELWVIDVSGQNVNVFSEPRADGYARCEQHAPPAALRPRAVEVDPLDLGELFRRL